MKNMYMKEFKRIIIEESYMNYRYGQERAKPLQFLIFYQLISVILYMNVIHHDMYRYVPGN